MYKREIGATECPFDSGRGVQWLFGQCPNEQRYLFGGASLILFWGTAPNRDTLNLRYIQLPRIRNSSVCLSVLSPLSQKSRLISPQVFLKHGH